MSNLQRGPKVRELSAKETLSSLESWKNSVLYGLRLDPEFRPYLNEKFVFGRKSRNQPNRELEDDVRYEKEEGKDTEVRVIVKTKEEKLIEVDLLLDQVANYCANIPRHDITRDSKSLGEVFIKIRQYYNKQPTGSLLNEVWKVKREVDETPQALFARMKQIYDDNLLQRDGLYHVEGPVLEDEELSPTLHNTIILHWMQVLHPELRDLVTQRFITQLREHTYAAIYPEISRSVDTLLEELSSSASACRIFTKQSSSPYTKQSFSQYRNPQSKPAYNPRQPPTYHKKKMCEFCKLTNKRYFYTHNTEDCLFIKRINETNSSSVKQVESELDVEDEVQLHHDEFFDVTGEESARQIVHVLNRVNVDASPTLMMEVEEEPCEATLDTGATCNVVSEEKAKKLKAVIRPTYQKVRMADGNSYLETVGETDITLFRKQKPFYLAAIVCKNTDTDILAGMPFLKLNDIAIRPYSDEVIINNKERVKYNPKHGKQSAVRRVTVHASQYHVLLPGEAEKFSVNNITGEVAVEPRWDNYNNKNHPKESQIWPKPQILPVIDGHISLSNTTREPVVIRKLEHICNLHAETDSSDVKPVDLLKKPSVLQPSSTKSGKTKFSDIVKLNPDNLLNKEDEKSIQDVLTMYDQVFDPAIGRYNGKSGQCHVEVNIGANLPIQRKGRIPFYGRGDLIELQDKFDKLVDQGIMSRPQDIGICVENINPSFLVRKQPPSTEKRLVTDFSSISQYCRPTPSLMPNVDSTLQNITTWKYIIRTDMSSAYHQIAMKTSSKKYCGVHTPYKGLLVYNVGSMGLPGVEVALEELTCLVLGDLVKKGKVAKLADDLFIGGNTVQELTENFQCVLQRFLENNIRLSGAKTVIAPKSVTILGWVWSAGTIRASPHRLSALSTCKKPETVTSLKSFIGAYRFLSRVIKSYAKWLSPLEQAIKGRDHKERIQWSESLTTAFKTAQEELQKAKTIVIPRPSDKLCIITDASVRPGAVGATLYAVRKGKQMLAGFYNCKLPEFQSRWLPCELEGLAIATALNHFAPVIIQSQEKPQVLTDSKPCVEAVQKLRKGQFSASARLSSFLSSCSRYQAEVLHISGAVNLPADFESRHPSQCNQQQCSICKFVSETMESVVQMVSVEEVLSGKTKLPFTNVNTWKAVQNECSDLRKVKTFKSQGTIPNKKSKNLKQVRRYLSAGTLLTHEGVLVHPTSSPLGPVIERIIVPQQVLHGFLSVLHLKLNHPTAYQLSKAFSRYFHALNLDKAISQVTKSCHVCVSIKDIPKAMVEETTETPPSTVGGRYAADVIKKNLQKILIIRETVTSYTAAEIIHDETVPSIAQSLIKMTNVLHPSPTGNILIRLDPHPSNQSIFNNLNKDQSLLKSNLKVEIGRTLNKNKNPVIDKAIKELHRELLILYPSGGAISPSQLSEAIASLNSRYRDSGLSAHELWTQRDQITGEQLPVKDLELINKQHQSREKNHRYSQKSKAHGKPFHPTAQVEIGSVVYIYNDGSKANARQRYIITSINKDWVILRKFSENLFMNKEYRAKREEIYKVPSFEELAIPEYEETSTDEDDEDCYKKPPRPFTYQASSSEVEETASSGDDADDDDDNEGENNQPDEAQEIIVNHDDPDYVPPKDIAPATMHREPRKTKKPDRFGAWSS